MSDLVQLYLTCFAIIFAIGFLTLIIAILAASYWTGSGNFLLGRTLAVTLFIALLFALPALWGWPTFFSAPISIPALFYLPFWLSAIWFGYQLDVKEAWTIIKIHWPLMVGIALFVIMPITSHLENEYERKQREQTLIDRQP